MGRNTKDVAQPWYSDGRRAQVGEHGRQRWMGDAVNACDPSVSVKRTVFAFRVLQS